MLGVSQCLVSQHLCKSSGLIVAPVQGCAHDCFVYMLNLLMECAPWLLRGGRRYVEGHVSLTEVLECKTSVHPRTSCPTLLRLVVVWVALSLGASASINLGWN